MLAVSYVLYMNIFGDMMCLRIAFTMAHHMERTRWTQPVFGLTVIYSNLVTSSFSVCGSYILWESEGCVCYTMRDQVRLISLLTRSLKRVRAVEC